MKKFYEEATHAELVKAYKQATGIQDKIDWAEKASREELIAEIKFSNKVGEELGHSSVYRLRNFVRAGKVPEGAWRFADELVEDIAQLAVEANYKDKEDEESRLLLSCIYKLLHYPFFDTKKINLKRKIAEIACLRTPTSIARGLRIRLIMKELRFAVESTVQGKGVMQENTPVKLAEIAMSRSWAYQTASKYLEACSRKATLRTLAIKVLQDQLKDEFGKDIGYEELDKDYKKTMRWLRTLKIYDIEAAIRGKQCEWKSHLYIGDSFLQFESEERMEYFAPESFDDQWIQIEEKRGRKQKLSR